MRAAIAVIVATALTVSEAIAAPSGYVPGDGFVIRDGAHERLRVGLGASYAAQIVDREATWTIGPPIGFVRPSLRAAPWKPWLVLTTSAELADNPPYLLDAYAEITAMPELGVRIGQQKTPISPHQNHGPTQILFPDRDITASYFYTGRDKGITVFGNLARGAASYALGAYMGTPLRQMTHEAGAYVVEGRIAFGTFSKPPTTEYGYALERAEHGWTFGLGGYSANNVAARESFDPAAFLFVVDGAGKATRNVAATLDATLQLARVVATAEVYVRRTEPDSARRYLSVGAWGQVGVMLYRRALDAAVRITWTDASVDAPNDRLVGGEAELAWYIHAPALVARLRYGLGDQRGDASGAVKLPTKPGMLQTMTAQIALAF